jgi:transposase-like protein
MHPNRSNRRVHSSEFKAQILAECRQPGASVSAVAIAHGLNTNVVRKWLAEASVARHDHGAALEAFTSWNNKLPPPEPTGR